MDDATIGQLHSLHPSVDIATSPLPERLSQDVLLGEQQEAIVARQIKKLKRGAAPGLSMLRAEHLRALLGRPDDLEAARFYLVSDYLCI